MLNYIKEQLAQRAAEMHQESAQVEAADVSAELLMEYAPIMQELDDLSLSGDGTDNAERPLIAIPLEAEDEEIPDIAGLTDKSDDVANDPELNSVELDLSNGNMMDVPMDANIQTEYAEMKTLNNFIQEGYIAIDPSEGQTAEDYDNTVIAAAKKNFFNYRNQVLQEQAFGFNKIPLSSESVTPAIIAEFATNVSSMLEPIYQVDKSGNIRNKQAESVDILNKYKHFSRMESFVESAVNFNKEDGSVWNSYRPVSMNVPIDPIDKHSVIVGLKNVKNPAESIFVRCSVPVLESWAMPTFELVSPEMITKMNKVSSKVVQEAIDFGGGDAGAAAPDANTAPQVDANAAPTVDTGAAPAEPAATDAGAAPAEPEVNAQPEKTVVPVETNNVSDQIAEKVATDTEIPTEAQNGDQTANAIDQAGETADALPEPTGMEAGAAPDPALDAGATDASLEPTGDLGVGGLDEGITAGVDDNNPSLDANASQDVDAQLNELDQMGATPDDTGIDEVGATPDGGMDTSDIGNMSVDEMIQAATDKIKTMPINAIQQFLSGNGSIQEGYVMEAMVTSKNVNDQLEANLKKCMGVLNDDELSFKGIENNFKKSGKQLNSVLSKAAKNSKVYSEEERKELTDLNSALTDLMVHFKPSKKEDLEGTKKKIVTFTAQAKKVDTIISKHKGAASAEPESSDSKEKE